MSGFTDVFTTGAVFLVALGSDFIESLFDPIYVCVDRARMAQICRGELS